MILNSQKSHELGKSLSSAGYNVPVIYLQFQYKGTVRIMAEVLLFTRLTEEISFDSYHPSKVAEAKCQLPNLMKGCLAAYKLPACKAFYPSAADRIVHLKLQVRFLNLVVLWMSSSCTHVVSFISARLATYSQQTHMNA